MPLNILNELTNFAYNSRICRPILMKFVDGVMSHHNQFWC